MSRLDISLPFMYRCTPYGYKDIRISLSFTAQKKGVFIIFPISVCVILKCA